MIRYVKNPKLKNKYLQSLSSILSGLVSSNGIEELLPHDPSQYVNSILDTERQLWLESCKKSMRLLSEQESEMGDRSYHCSSLSSAFFQNASHSK